MVTTPRALVLASLALACASPATTARVEPGQPAQDGAQAVAEPAADQGSGVLDLDRVFELSRELRLPSGHFSGWTEDGGYLATVEGQLVRADPAGGGSDPLYDGDAVQAAFEALPAIDAKLAGQLAGRARSSFSRGREAAVINARNDLFHYRLGDEHATRLTHDPLDEKGETLSPDGSMVAYISDWNLHVVPTEGGPEAKPRALTSDGDENHLYGRLDWVYQEEIYGRGNFGGFWWSPDSRRIAFLILDESPVPEFTIPDHRKDRPDVEVWRYPKAGDPNPKATLAVVDVAGGAFRLMDLSRYATQEFLIVRCGWTPDSSEVIVQVQDRVQTWLDVVAADPVSGDTRVLFRERTGVWVEPTGAPYWIEVQDGDELEDQFLWLSERDGYKHLYRYDRDGELLGRLTEGKWEVDTYHGFDAETQTVYFSGDQADVKGQQLFRVGLDGSGLTRISEGAGTHRVSLSPDFEHYVDTFSSHAEPPRLTMHRIDGSEVRRMTGVDAKVAEDAGLITPEFHKVKTRDGFEMEAMLVKPKDFQEGVRYPVVSYTYSGPHAPSVRDSYFNFNGLYHQMFAHEGYLIWICDNRSASGKGLESVKPVYRNLGSLELRDLEDGIAYLVDKGWADPERVALWGWSYGGYMTAFALTHSEVFSVGVVGAPVTDWRLYDTIYTERYMDTPQANPEGYDRSSVVKAAGNLHGKMLIVHGVIDENVHMQNSLQLANALQDGGHLFELMLYPGNRHGVVQPKQRRHLYTMMADFIRRNL